MSDDGRASRQDPRDPVLITNAPMSPAEELAERRRRYSIIMAMRIPCLVLAAVFYQTPWLAALLVIVSIPLPWCAVIIANDRLPRRAGTFRRYRGEPGAAQLEAREHRVIDS